MSKKKAFYLEIGGQKMALALKGDNELELVSTTTGSSYMNFKHGDVPTSKLSEEVEQFLLSDMTFTSFENDEAGDPPATEQNADIPDVDAEEEEEGEGEEAPEDSEGGDFADAPEVEE